MNFEPAPNLDDSGAQTVSGTFWAMTNSCLNLSAGCYWGTNGVLWTGTNGLKVLSWSNTNLVFSPSNSVATSYVVRAAAVAQTNWFDTATVNVFSVNIVPTSTNVNWIGGCFLPLQVGVSARLLASKVHICGLLYNTLKGNML